MLTRRPPMVLRGSAEAGGLASSHRGRPRRLQLRARGDGGRAAARLQRRPPVRVRDAGRPPVPGRATPWSPAPSRWPGRCRGTRSRVALAAHPRIGDRVAGLVGGGRGVAAGAELDDRRRRRGAGGPRRRQPRLRGAVRPRLPHPGRRTVAGGDARGAAPAAGQRRRRRARRGDRAAGADHRAAREGAGARERVDARAGLGGRPAGRRGSPSACSRATTCWPRG